MADYPITFGAADLFALADTKLTANNSNNALAKAYAEALNAKGDVAAVSPAHDIKNEVTQKYTFAATSGLKAKVVKIRPGIMAGGFLLTKVELDTNQTAFPTLSVTGHNHAVNPHDTSVADKRKRYNWGHDVTPAPFDGGMGSGDFCGATDTSLNYSAKSSKYVIGCQHKDELNAAGNHLVGEDYNGRIEVTTDYIGVPTTFNATLHITSEPAATDNQGFYTLNVSGWKQLTQSDT